MFVYEKRLEYPIRIKNTNPKLAALIISQYGGPYGSRLRRGRAGRAGRCGRGKNRPPARSEERRRADSYPERGQKRPSQ